VFINVMYVGSIFVDVSLRSQAFTGINTYTFSRCSNLYIYIYISLAAGGTTVL
jgi:hypothetical protein